MSATAGYPAEPLNAHPEPRQIIGAYLYAPGADAAGLSDVIWRRAGVSETVFRLGAEERD